MNSLETGLNPDTEELRVGLSLAHRANEFFDLWNTTGRVPSSLEADAFKHLSNTAGDLINGSQVELGDEPAYKYSRPLGDLTIKGTL